MYFQTPRLANIHSMAGTAVLESAIPNNESYSTGTMPGTTMTDTSMESIICRSQKGDRRAQKELFASCKVDILRIIWRMMGPIDKNEVEEIVQQTFIELFKSLGSFKGNSTFSTWIYRICTTTCNGHIRKKYRKKYQMECPLDNEDKTHGDVQYNPDETLRKKEIHRTIYAALNKLNVDRRAVLVLFEIEGRSIEEISSILAIPVGTVKSRLSRARAELETNLAPIYDT